MDIARVLRDTIKPELNFLYTERPFRVDGGWDYGWFCREHAFHCFFLFRMLGLNCDIKLGDLSVHEANGSIVASTFNDVGDHAWVSVDDVCPVDLSLSFQHFQHHVTNLPPLDLVYGQGVRGAYLVTYVRANASSTEDTSQNPALHQIRYSERTTLDLSEENLLQAPYRFLFQPRRNALTEVLGKDIFDRVTVHLYRIAIGEIKPFFPYVKPVSRAFEKIRGNNPDATDYIRRILKRETKR